MAAETVTVAVTNAAYTALTSSHTYVAAFVRTGQFVRFHLGTSLPAADTDSYVLLQGVDNIVFNALGATDVLYARAEKANATVVVMRS